MNTRRPITPADTRGAAKEAAATAAEDRQPSPLERLIRGNSSRREPLGRILHGWNAAWLCVIAALGLSVIGVHAIDVAEATEFAAASGAGEPVRGLSAVAWRQAVFLLVGMLAATVVALPHFKYAGALSWLMLLGCVGLLVYLLVPGVPLVTARNGARAWIDFGIVDFQPSEVAKIAYVLAVARYLRHRSTHRTLGGLVVPGLITMVPVGLITLQPDLGTASLFVPALLAMLIAAGARLRHIGIVVLGAALAAPAAYPLLKEHQKVRIVGLIKQFQGDESSASDINFQAYTAQDLIGAGGAIGMPDRAARALVHFGALPERHNDTVYAVVVTRWGFLGGAAVIVMYGLWLLGAVVVAARHREPQARLIGVGLAAFIASQAVVNIGMNLGLLPIIGITLPFVSYGGSSLVTVWLMTGLVMSVGLHPARPPFRRSFEYGDDDAEESVGSKRRRRFAA